MITIKKVKYTALSGMCTALTVVLMAVTAVLPVLVYVLPIITGVLVWFVSEICGKKYGVLTYASSCVLLLLLITDKESALTYALVFGYYPIIRESFARMPKLLSLGLKLLVFNAAAVLIGVAGVYIFGMSGEEYSEFGKLTIPILLVLANTVFFIYDRALAKYQILVHNIAERVKKKI